MSDISSANYAALYPKGQAAITANLNYLAIPAPTQTQAVAQVAVLTRQVNAVMRILLGLLDSTDGT
jgi:hypothetical protein